MHERIKCAVTNKANESKRYLLLMSPLSLWLVGDKSARIASVTFSEPPSVTAGDSRSEPDRFRQATLERDVPKDQEADSENTATTTEKELERAQLVAAVKAVRRSAFSKAMAALVVTEQVEEASGA